MDGGRGGSKLRAAAIVLGGLLLAAIAGPAPVGAQGGGTFTLPIIDNARMWPIVGGLPNILVNKVLYSTLVKYDPRNWQPVGDLAERWTLSDDRLTWTFVLRRNVTWHDGRPVFYSLGNFLFHTLRVGAQPVLRRPDPAYSWRSLRSPLNLDSAVALVRAGAGGVTGIELVPVRLNGVGDPELAAGDDAVRILDALAAQSAPLGATLTVADGRGWIR
jgi:hypothetical protein